MHNTHTSIIPVFEVPHASPVLDFSYLTPSDLESCVLTENIDRKHVCSDVLPPLTRLHLLTSDLSPLTFDLSLWVSPSISQAVTGCQL